MSRALPHSSTHNREAILYALKTLSDELGNEGVTGEVCLFGGTVMVLAYSARLATKDVDALFQPAPLIRRLARQLGEAQGGDLPQFPHLRLTMPVPEYLLAMKCMAARLGGTEGAPSDLPDIIFLIRHLRLPTAAAVLEIVAHYYPASHVPAKTQFLVEGLFEAHIV